MPKTFSRHVVILVLLVLAPAAAGFAQVKAGDASLDLSGSVSSGYSGSYGNEGPSSHGIGFGGTGDLSGFYHSSQFFSFDVDPFYNQSRNDSSFQSITDSTGLTTSATIFGGSKYPGRFNYSNVYNTEGNYLVPGIANYRTSGNSQTLGVAWSANPTNTLSFSAGYQNANNNSSVYGTNSLIESNFNSLFATSNYTVAGFRLGGGVHYSTGNYMLPQIVTGQTNQTSQADTTAYNLSLTRGVGFDGSTWVNYSRNTTGYNALGTRESETADVVTAGVFLKPLKKLSTSFGGDYDDNLAGTLYQAANSAGVVVPLSLPADRSHSWGLFGQAQYNVADQLYFTGDVTHRQQQFLGTAFNSTSYSGGVNYGRELWGGRLTAGTIVTRSGLGNVGGSMTGLWSNATYIRQIGVWNTSGSFGYSRNVQTILIAYTTSGYSYATSVGRRIGRLNWNGTAGGSKSLLSESTGTTSYTQTYSTGLSTGRVGVSAGYSKSSGMGLFTAQGISTLPPGLPPPLLSSPIFYGGTTYSFGLGGEPVRGLTFSGSFADTRSNTQNGLLASSNHTQEGNVYTQYRFRKMFFTAGYSRLLQGFSASTLAPAMVTTYYVGLSRWFNFF